MKNSPTSLFIDHTVISASGKKKSISFLRTLISFRQLISFYIILSLKTVSSILQDL